ncbi:MAG: Hsp70 family protein [Paludibaculum sp.]
MSVAKCDKCGVWEILPNDNYCSFCTQTFISIDLKISPASVPADELAQVQLTIQNLSSEKPIQIDSIECSADWLSPDISRVRPAFSLLRGAEMDIPLNVDTDGLDTSLATVTVRSTAGNASENVHVYPLSDVAIEADHNGVFELILDDSREENIRARVLCLSGKVGLKEFALSPAGICTPVSVTTLPAELQSDKQGRDDPRPVEFLLRFDKEKLRQLGPQLPLVVPCAVTGSFADPFGNEFERTLPLTVKCLAAPAMAIWEWSDPVATCLTGKVRNLRLTVQNIDSKHPDVRGRAPLLVNEVRVTTLAGEPIPWIERKGDASPALHVESGQKQSLEFTVWTEGATPDGHAAAPVGQHVLRFQFSTNMGGTPRTLDFLINVEEPPEFDGVLAVDFGTSNSCAAYLGTTERRCSLAQIDRASPPGERAKSPTLLQFLKLNDEEPATDYGQQVQGRMTAPEALNSVVRSVKRRLGRTEEKDKIPVRFLNDRVARRSYLPNEVTAMYLEHIRRELEDTSGYRFRRLAITHPARFKLRQIEDLKTAVKRAFGDVELTCYQEPIAAGLQHILGELDKRASDYTLGVFDSGGGTTDLSLIRVENHEEDGRREWSVTLLASTGKWFGGEDITEFVITKAVEKMDGSLASKSGKVLVKPEQYQEPDHRAFARQNYLRLWAWAEKAKLELACPNSIKSQPPVTLTILTAGSCEDRLFQSADLLPDEKLLDDFLRREVDVLATMLQDLVAKHNVEKLDCVLLSGMTSSIPAIKNIIQKKFPTSNVILSGDPKQCVVKGACHLEDLRHALGFQLKVIGRSATVSRIGFADRSPSMGWAFNEMLAAGQPIPEEGLTAYKPLYLRPASVIELLENDSDRDELGEDNRDITPIGRYRQMLTLPPGGAWVEVRLRVTPDLECELSGRLAGSQDEFTLFEPVRLPGAEIQ